MNALQRYIQRHYCKRFGYYRPSHDCIFGIEEMMPLCLQCKKIRGNYERD